MNAKQFTDSIAHNLRGVHFFSVGSCPGCAECGLEETECNACDGTGTTLEGVPEVETTCERCRGTGKITPTERDREGAEEGGFSWSACDSCESHLGGNRYPAHGIIAESMEAAQKPESTITHFDICADCLCYHANGDLPGDEQ